jgi:hypothetical protein
MLWMNAWRRRLIGMFMRSFVVAAYAALTLIATASAQMPSPRGPEPAPSAFDPDPIIQITTTFRARIEGLADPRAVPSPTAQDTARRAVYNMAANECTVLVEIWRAECRLNSLSVYMALVNTGEPGPEPPQFPSMIGTAVFELKPRPSGP